MSEPNQTSEQSAHPDCQLLVEPMKQCCCKCIHHRAVHFHCCTEPKPTSEQLAAIGSKRCVCGVQKGWACANPEMEVIHDNWPEHSCGCECYTTKEGAEKGEARSKKARDLLFRTEYPNAPVCSGDIEVNK